MEFQSRPSILRACFVAVDGGPRETLAPVAAYCSTALADVAPDAALAEAHWQAAFAAADASLLVVGTSDSGRGRAIEIAARRAARAAGIPIAAIEDFPGNYVDAPGSAVQLLLVESDLVRDFWKTRLGARAPLLPVVPPARYDHYRSATTGLTRETAALWSADPRGHYRVLWAGQPDTADCLHTLHALLPALLAQSAQLLFKAHPRDAGYVAGEYSRLLGASGVRWTDITSASVEHALARAPHLVVTQFSSVAIEAGFYGIPSLWVLLPGAGADRLRAKKGYVVPPLCEQRAAALCRAPHDLTETVLLALTNVAYRDELILNFQGYFGAEQSTLRETMEYLSALIDPP